MNSSLPPSRSVFDRLVDSSYAHDAGNFGDRELIASIEKDLEFLLNSRQTFEGLDSFPELQKSIIGFGLPDANSFDLETPSARFRLAQTIEAVIQTFEPRICNVRVEFQKKPSEIHSLSMQIDATLNTASAAEISFATTLKLATGHYVINEFSSPDNES